MAATALPTPYVLQCGRQGDDDQQFFVICESQVILEVSTLTDAIVALFASYYVFDIEYPKACLNTLHFIERFILKLPGTQVAKASLGTISDIYKMK